MLTFILIVMEASKLKCCKFILNYFFYFQVATILGENYLDLSMLLEIFVMSSITTDTAGVNFDKAFDNNCRKLNNKYNPCDNFKYLWYIYFHKIFPYMYSFMEKCYLFHICVDFAETEISLTC